MESKQKLIATILKHKHKQHMCHPLYDHGLITDLDSDAVLCLQSPTHVVYKCYNKAYTEKEPLFLNRSEDSLPFLLRIVVITKARNKKRMLKKDALTARQALQGLCRVLEKAVCRAACETGGLGQRGRTAETPAASTLAEFQSDKASENWKSQF